MHQRLALDARDRYFGRFIASEGGFDANAFVQRMLLFEEVVIGGPGHLDGLMNLFGVGGLIEVLESGAVHFLSSVHMIGWEDYRRHGLGHGQGLPLMSWFVELMYVVSPPPLERFEREARKVLAQRGIADDDQERIVIALLDRVETIRWPKDAAITGLRADIAARPQLVLEGVLDGVEKKLNRPVPRESVRFAVRESGKAVFAAETNLAEVLGVNRAEAHELIGPALAAYVGSHMQFDLLSGISAVGELRDVDAQFLERRSDLFAQLVTDQRPAQFLRALEIREVPGLSPGDRLDSHQLLKLREHPDTMAFRDWLRHAGQLDDAVVRELLGGWRAKLAMLATGPGGRVVRWLASTGLGVVTMPGGIALSAADSFLVDKLIAPPGPAAFVDRHYRQLVVNAKAVGKQASKAS